MLDEEDGSEQEDTTSKVHEDMFVTSLSSEGKDAASKEPAGHVGQPPAFHEREAYKDLLHAGYIRMPPVFGYRLSHHSQTRQWHAHHVGDNKNFAPSWSPTIRSEQMALLLVMCRIWKW